MPHRNPNPMQDQINKKAVLLIATTTSFLMPFMGSAITVALPSIEKAFSMSAVLLSWIISAYLLSVALFLVPIGKLSDIYGRKRIFIYGLAIFTGASFLAAVSFSPVTLIIVRIIQGAGAAMLFGMGVAIITSVYPAGERGKVLGINVAAVYTGLSCGPFVGGILTHYLGWRSIFFINVPLGIFILILVLKQLKFEWAEARGERFDTLGSILYGLVLIAIMLGLSFLPSTRGIILVLAGIIGFCIFIYLETRTPQPVLDINLFTKNTVFAFSNLAALINYSATFAVSFLLSLYLQYIKGLSPQHTGLVLVAQPVTQAIFSPFAGRLSDKIEPLFVASAGMLVSAIGLFMFVFLHNNTSLLFVVVSLTVIGLGFALFSSPNTNAVMSSVERKFLGVASATLGTMRLLGQMLSMGLVTMIFTFYLGPAKITPAQYPLLLKGTKTSFLIFTLLCLAGIVASMMRGRVHNSSTKR